jgi:hypothetical protein
MKLLTPTPRRLITGIVLALAVAAVVAPAGQARPEGMTPLQWQQWQAERAADDQGLSAVDRERIKSTSNTASVNTVSGRVVDRLERGDLVTTSGTSSPIQVPAASTVEGSGFDWGDASIGAGGAIVLGLMLGAVLVATRRLSGDSRGRLAT